MQVLVSIVIHLMVVELGKYGIRRVDAAKEAQAALLTASSGGAKSPIAAQAAAPAADRANDSRV